MSRNYHRRNARSDAVIELLGERSKLTPHEETAHSKENAADNTATTLGEKDENDVKRDKTPQ